MSLYEQNVHISFISVLVLFYVLGVQCYPKRTTQFFNKDDLKDEVHLENGTVLGKYNYVDTSGNPVQVKYFADDLSYGVELKSIKLVDPNNNLVAVQSDKQIKFDNTYQPLESSVDLLSDYQNSNISSNLSPSKYLQTVDLSKESRSYANNASPDYDIYLQNELPGSKSDKDKVRIYIDNGKRRIREILNDVATFKYFDQY